MGGYSDDLFNVFWRMEPHVMAREGFAYGGQGGGIFRNNLAFLKPSKRWKMATTPVRERPGKRCALSASPELRRCCSESS